MRKIVNLILILLIFCAFTYDKIYEAELQRMQDNSKSRGSELIGQAALDWEVSDWFNSDPLALTALRGKVVLVRFWTGPECPFCRASAQALNEFYNEYHDQGLEVIGIYHHKESLQLNKKNVRKLADQMGFRFPVAIDHDWITLKKWWLDEHQRSWTSVSFLIDKKGIIQHIHPGGQYVKGDQAYAILKAKIEELLK